MPALLAGVAALILILILARKFVAANPAQLANVVRLTVGGLLLVAAVVLIFTGRWGIGVAAGAVGAGLVGRAMAGAGSRWQRTAGTSSNVRSDWLAMELDLDDGRLTGSFTQGPYEGRDLDSLSIAELTSVAAALDEESRQLLEAYLDRRAPGWREDLNADAAPGGRESHARSGPMSKNEAYEILGLQPGASVAAIRKAHRALMARVHPDHGGSTYLAARINAAKDVLLDSHRRRS